MEKNTQENLEELILEQKRLVAESHFLDVWENALNDGIDDQIIARALIKGALIRVAKTAGDKEAASIIGEIKHMEVAGDFLPGKTIQ